PVGSTDRRVVRRLGRTVRAEHKKEKERAQTRLTHRIHPEHITCHHRSECNHLLACGDRRPNPPPVARTFASPAGCDSFPVAMAMRAPLCVPVELRRGSRWFRLAAEVGTDGLGLSARAPEELIGPLEVAFHLPGDPRTVRCRARLDRAAVELTFLDLD